MDFKYWEDKGYELYSDENKGEYIALIGEGLIDICDLNDTRMPMMKWDGKWIPVDDRLPIPDIPPIVWNKHIPIITDSDINILWPLSLCDAHWLIPFIKNIDHEYHTHDITKIYDIDDIIDMNNLITQGSPCPDDILIYNHDDIEQSYYNRDTYRHLLGWEYCDQDIESGVTYSMCIWLHEDKVLRSRHDPIVEGMNKEYAYMLLWWDIPSEIYLEAKKHDYTVYNSHDEYAKCTALFHDDKMMYFICEDKEYEMHIFCDKNPHSILLISRDQLISKVKEIYIGDSFI